MIVPEHVWSSIKDPAKFTNTKPVGTGPFTLEKFAPTQYTLKKNPDYWQADKIAPDEVVMPAQSTNQSTNQLDVTSGKFDWSYNYLPDVEKTFVDKDPDNTYWFPPGGVIGLFMNLTKAPYSNVDFRKGVSLAIDRDTIADKAVNGYETGASQSGLILPNLEKWLDPSIPDKGNVSQDTKARARGVPEGRLHPEGRQAGRLLRQAGRDVDHDAVELQRLGRGRQGGRQRARRRRHQGLDRHPDRHAVHERHAVRATTTWPSAGTAGPVTRTPTSTTC